MPETRFQIEWPDGSQETCYSPSLVVKKFLEPGTEYDLNDFVERSRTALKEGSDRVQAKFGFPCSLALGQLQRIETTAAQFPATENSKVKLLGFVDC
jgi:uncharacterized repeat protein (TIGR04042 family)